MTDDEAGRAPSPRSCARRPTAPTSSLLDAGAATAQLRAAVHGVLYLHGGWSSLVDGLAAVVRGTAARSSPARPSRPSSTTTRVHAVRLADGGTLPAAAVVVAVQRPAPGRRAARRRRRGSRRRRRRRRRPGAHGPPRRRPAAAAVDPVPEPPRASTSRSTSTCRARSPTSRPMVARSSTSAATCARARSTSTTAPSLEAVLDLHQPDWRDHVVDARYVPRSMVSGDHARVATRGTAGRPPVDAAGRPRPRPRR